jgi:hypothetical protein
MPATSLKRIVETDDPAAYLPLDLAFLAKQTLGDDALADEILRLFDTMAHTYMERIVQSPSPEAMLPHLHTLKGASAGVGAFDLREMVRVAEASIQAGRGLDPEAVADLSVAVEAVSAFIAHRIELAA